jgi:hypothetical protein
MPRPITRAPVNGVCRVCGSSDFGTRNRCKPCRAKAQREAYARESDEARAKDSARSRAWRKANPQQVRAQDLRKRYGLTRTAYENLAESQGRRCAICRASSLECVDHCHATGRIRGLLCRRCNAALGQFRDDPKRLREAAIYLETQRDLIT